MVTLAWLIGVCAALVSLYAATKVADFDIAFDREKKMILFATTGLWLAGLVLGVQLLKHFNGYVSYAQDKPRYMLMWSFSTLCLTCTLLMARYVINEVTDSYDFEDIAKAAVIGIITFAGLISSVITIAEFISRH